MERARWAVWDLPAALVPMNYIEQVQRAGATALMIPPDPALVDDPGRVLGRLDGLMLVGGPDVEAGRYGAEPHPMAEPPAALRDAVELALVREAIARGVPVLGICRGMQVINVAAGGTLRQHLPEEVGSEEHRRVVGAFAGNEHEVSLGEGTRARAASDGSPHLVVSHHHQSVDEVGEGLCLSGWSEVDGVAEAIESVAGPWVLGVQWHPEADPRSGVIPALVERARSRMAAEGADRDDGDALPVRAARRDERS